MHGDFRDIKASMARAAAESDILLLDTCVLGGKTRPGQPRILDCVYNNECTIGYLRSYQARCRAVADAVVETEKIMVTPEVVKETDDLEGYLWTHRAFLSEIRGSRNAGIVDAGDKLEAIDGILASLRDIKRAKRPAWNKEFEYLALLYSELSNRLGCKYGETDIRISARALYENLCSRKVGIITDDNHQVDLLNNVYPAFKSMSCEQARDRLRTAFTKLYMPAPSGYNYSACACSWFEGGKVPKRVRKYREDVETVTERIVSPQTSVSPANTIGELMDRLAL